MDQVFTHHGQVARAVAAGVIGEIRHVMADLEAACRSIRKDECSMPA